MPLTIEDLIQQAERRKQNHEQAKRLFEDGTLTLYRNNVAVPRDECVAKEELGITNDDELIEYLRNLQCRPSGTSE